MLPKAFPMKAIKTFVVLLLAAASAAMIVRVAIPRLNCNLAKGRVNRSTPRLWDDGREFERATTARRHVAICRQCIAAFPYDHQWRFLLGTNLRILGEREEALRSLREAIALAERPETYAQIAEVEIELGNVEAARAALLQAATFQVAYASAVDGPLRQEVEQVVYERYERLTGKVTR